MASRPVPAQYLKAGQEYQDALVLCLVPDYLGWAWDFAAEQWQLALVTSIVDAGGPLALNRLLFKAYNAKATPKEISPFIVRIFSPDIMPREFWPLAYKNVFISHTSDRPDRPNKLDEPIEIQNMHMTFLGLEFEMNNGYQTLRPMLVKQKYIDRRRSWERFRNNVEKLAV